MLKRILTAVGVLGVGANSVLILVHAFGGEDNYVRDFLPTHLLFMAFLIGYLVFLQKTLFPALSGNAEIRYDEAGLSVTLGDKVWQAPWEEVRGIRFGDIYLRIEFGDGPVEVPFILSEEQRELYRMHFRRTGLTPDSGRFLAKPSRE